MIVGNFYHKSQSVCALGSEDRLKELLSTCAMCVCLEQDQFFHEVTFSVILKSEKFSLFQKFSFP